MDEHSASFGDWLRRRRRALDLTQAALADKVSCSQAAIKKIEAGERRPSRALAQRLAEHLGIPAPERAAPVQAARQGRRPALARGYGPDAAAASHEGVPPPAAPAATLAHATPATPFVGRADHFQILGGLLAQAQAGAGQVALLQGEAGIGKSRLLQETVTEAGRRGLAAVSTNCYEIERSIAYQPVVDLAGQACALLPQARLERIGRVPLAELAELVPDVAARVPGLPALSADFPEARQTRLFHALAQLFDALAEGQGLLVVADNVQWADDASLRFLHYYARQVGRRRVLLACAFREDEFETNQELEAVIATLRGDSHARHLLLPRLSLADIELLLARLDPPPPPIPGLATRLLRESEGNPFFLWSLLHAWGEGAAAGGAQALLPEDLRDSVRTRLARISPQHRALLELAAVMGRRFHFEMLLALSPGTPEAFLQALDALVRRRLLRQEAEGGFYDFSHDKVREVVYQDIGAARRVLLHRQVGQLLEPQASEEAHELHGHLAEHYERGETWHKAVHYLALAAEHSLKLFAIRESLQWFDRAIALVQQHRDAASPAQQMALYERRGAARAQVGQTEGAVADFQQAIAQARALGEQAHARDVLTSLGMAYRRADCYEEAIACLDEALAAARSGGDERHVADSLYHLGTVAWSNGRNDLAIGYHQEAVDLCERLQLRDVVAVQAWHGRGEACFADGQPAEAMDCFARSLELARAIGDRSYEAENLMMLGWASGVPMGLGEPAQALSFLEPALEIARAADLQWHLGPSLIGRAFACTALARTGEARSDLQEALPQLEALGLVRYQIMAHDAMGNLLLEEGRPGDAERHFEHALVLAGSAGIRYWLARVEAGLALARLRRGGSVDRDALRASLRAAQERRETWLVPRCLEALAEAALSEDDAPAALAHAGELLALASRSRMGQVAQVARRLQDRAARGGLGQ
jgi:tetratricopeptide (TPR) repeat protein/transcriptional regulator with XRE-family HTH domain